MDDTAIEVWTTPPNAQINLVIPNRAPSPVRNLLLTLSEAALDSNVKIKLRDIYRKPS
jgi:hypothetical protein